jgi:uncharacterized protein (TIGR02453 family)
MKTPLAESALVFFSELALNNERDWFQANKARYEAEVLAPLRDYVEEIGPACAARDLPLRGDPTKSVFRIYRDVRFSNDKSPYKVHAGVQVTRHGEKHTEGLLYLHVDPRGSFLACGFYQPNKPLLEGFRKAMTLDPQSWFEIVRSVGEFSEDDLLSRVPRGFEAFKGTELEPWLKYKGFIAHKNLEDAELFSPNLPELAADFATKNRALLDWGWKIHDSLGLLPE